MYQCTACGLLSVRDTSCPGCGGMSFVDLEAEDSTSLEGFGDVPGLDEAAMALHEIAPEPEQEPIQEEEPQGDLPFGFGGRARSHAPSLPFGFGASSQGLAALAQSQPPSMGEEGPTGESQPTAEQPPEQPWQEAPEPSETPAIEDPVETPSEPVFALPPIPAAEPVPLPQRSPVESNPAPAVVQNEANSLPEIPSLWAEPSTDVRQAYGLPNTSASQTEDEAAPSPPAGPIWPPFAVVAPEAALLDGLLREPTVEAFRALAGEDWAVARERLELLLATGIDGTSLRTAAGIACMELGDQATAGLQHLKQAAKLSGGDLKTIHNLALGMAMDGRVEAVDRLLASVGGLPDEGGFLTRMHDARKMMETSSA